MARYQKTELKSHKKGYCYNTTYYSTIPEEDNDIHLITQIGDRLDLLANQYYGNSDLWWYIAKANNLSDLRMEAGMRIRIPGTTKYARGY